MKAILVIYGLLVSAVVFGKNRPGSNSLMLAVSPQYYFNGYNIRNDGISPDPIRVRNSMGYYFGAAYERVTKYGLTFSAGFRIGERKHLISIYRDMSDFDSTASGQLKGVVYNHSFDIKLCYINPALTVGYEKQISSKWTAVARAGVFVTCYLNGFVDVGEVDVSYLTDDLQTNKTVRFLAYQAEFGEALRDVRAGKYSLLNKIFGHTINVGTVYIGLKHQFEKSFVSNCTFGIEFTRSLSSDAVALQWMEVKSRIQANNSTVGSIDTYQDQYVSVALRLGIGLWR